MHNRNIMPRITANPPITPPKIAPVGDLFLLKSSVSVGAGRTDCVAVPREELP